MRRSEEMKLAGHGLYDIAEVSRLVGVSVETLSRWALPTSRRAPLLQPQLDPFFSFHDLITAQIIRELSRRGVRLAEIGAGMDYLKSLTGVDRPFAHREMIELATSGRSWFGEIDGEQIDLGRGGQIAWGDAVTPTLRAVTYGDGGMAAIWRPVNRIWLNPHIQAGASCIDESRTTTRFIWDLVGAGTEVYDIAWQFELELDDVIAARDFEKRLDEREPLHLVGS